MMKVLKGLLGLAQREDATTGELAPSLPTAEAELVAAREAQAAAEAAYKANLLTSDDTGLRRLVEARTDAGVRVDRATALVEALRERLAEAEAREAEAARVQRYEAARRQADDAAAALREMYPHLAQGLVDLLRGVAEAEIAVSDVNADLPRGAERIPSVEGSVRDVPGTPRQFISEETVERWCRPGERMPGALDQSRVRIGHDRRGYVQPSSGQIEYLVKRTYTERRFIESIPGNPAYDLAVRLSLPGLRADDAPFFKPADPMVTPGPRGVLRMLNSLAAQAAGRSTPRASAEQVELELIGAVDLEEDLRQTATLADKLAGRA
ncbi:hypothetical protein Q8W71_07315 [Methylobacterium sp. NEAU 140]|uniref:hypothetical protein n=1 Tax=Methylobacterium sp. NEAU 140 TaxID=3064945 RepID=UPI002732A13B|nr:hypothetical protein [Methylobacterium sp. NEAU 140]MDP4022426.1 hypothetical protein [Methylobacterium sp. NEAU 140]